jgi:hypothetical protein
MEEEIASCREPGLVDAGTHIVAIGAEIDQTSR